MDFQMFTRRWGSVLTKAFPFGVIGAVWAVILAEVIGDIHPDGKKNLFYHPWAYQVFSVCVTFTLVFRNSISYNRFWEACTQITFMRSKMGDVAMQAMAFDRIYNTELAVADQKNWDGQSTLYKTQRFQRRIVHLVSLLHASALLALRKRTVDLEFQPLSYLVSHERNWGAKQLMCVANPDSLLLPSASDTTANADAAGPTEPKASPPPAYGHTNFSQEDFKKERSQERARRFPTRVAWNEYCKFFTGCTYNGSESSDALQAREGMADKVPQELLFPVIGGISEIEKKCLLDSYDKMTSILGWVTQEVSNRFKEGGMRVAPPVISRLFQELSNGMLGYNQAYKVTERPFPFPYTQMVFILLLVHLLALPMTMVAFCRETPTAALLSFLVIEMFFALEMVARELENVFGTDANDLDLQEFQADFNLQLESLLSADVQNQFKMLCCLPEHWDIDEPTLFVKYDKSRHIGTHWGMSENFY
jgi:predicted membrane chloride channel (bestrophin family)